MTQRVIATMPTQEAEEGSLAPLGMTQRVIATKSPMATEEGSLAFALLRLGMTGYTKCSAIFSRRNAMLRSSCGIPSTPSSMLIQPSKPAFRRRVKMAS